jgi:pimeloyl-ACP methyl ester carboxylesterase
MDRLTAPLMREIQKTQEVAVVAVPVDFKKKVIDPLDIYNLESSIHKLKQCLTMIAIRFSVVLAIIGLITLGCTQIKSSIKTGYTYLKSSISKHNPLEKMKRNYAESLESTVIVGRVYGEFTEKGPIIVAACSTDKGKKIATYTVLHGSGEYEIGVDHGKYYVFAFLDKNSNLIYDAGEPAGQYGNPKLVRASRVGVVYDIDMKIPKAGSNIVVPPGTEIAAIKPKKLYSRQAGVIADLDDERFSEEYGSKGFWEPGPFFNQLGGNIYFLEKYDPKKIPILFIHGATGTPRGWRYFVDHIDRTRFQPWFFYYPSGARIDSMAYLLLWKLTNLQSKYQFNRIYITAHSMGGLVARSFIVNYGAQFPFVKLFITLATPWGGDKMAALGVKQSPVILPVWLDMQPNGDFIKSLYRKKLPESVSFYMFSGCKGSRNPFRSNNDSTIALASAQDFRPQSEAKMNYVFNEDHDSILVSKEVVEQYDTILADFDEKQRASSHRSGGYVQIHFEYTYAFNGIRPRPVFILLPKGKKNAKTVSYLSNNDNGRILGPFPAGDYFAAMAAMAAKPQKKFVPVTIEKNKTKELNFSFSPDGVIHGCVAAPYKPDDKFSGRPDDLHRSVDETIRIQFVRLNGNGIRRTLQPAKKDGADDVSLLTRKSFCNHKCFDFYGLSAGEYQLVIKAQGYQPLEKEYAVKPGVPQYFRVTELTPE